MKLVVTLNQRSRRILHWVSKKTRDVDTRVRCQILLQVSRGESGNRVSAGLGCVPSTTSRTVARFHECGILCIFDQRNQNGDLKVDADVQAGIARILEGTAEEHGSRRPTWTLEFLQLVIARELGVALSVGHLWKVLRSMGIRLGQPKPFVSCPWPAAKREARLRRLRRLVDSIGPDEALLFLDEVDIHLNPKIGRDWMLPGQQRRVKTPGQNVKRYIAGAYDPVRNRMIYVEGDRKASWLFLNLLRAILTAYRNKKAIHLILDNYKIHKSECVATWFRMMGDKIRLHFLPPYCPDENRIERIWKDLHDNVTRNHTCATMAALLTAIRAWLDARFWTHRGICIGC